MIMEMEYLAHRVAALFPWGIWHIVFTVEFTLKILGLVNMSYFIFGYISGEIIQNVLDITISNC